MMTIARASAVVCGAALSACASAASGSGGTPGQEQWTGSFRQGQTAASAVIGPATTPRGAAYGTVTLTAVPSQAGHWKVDLSMSAPVESSTPLAWAIFSGPCGSPTPSVIGLNEFQVIELTSGTGGIHATMAMPLDPHGTYHATIYWSSRASDVSNVMMCTNLSHSG